MKIKLQERKVFMKKGIKVLVLCLLMLSVVCSSLAFASEEIKVTINGKRIEFDVQPQLINDRTMVPLRAIFETLGAEVEWNGDTQTVSATKDKMIVVSTIGSNIMYVNDEEKTMDVAPVIKDGRTLVPARFVAEAFGCSVDWDGNTNTVIITSNEKLTDKEIINLVKEYVGDDLLVNIEKTFTYNSSKYYQVDVKAKNSSVKMTSYIVSDDGIEFFEGEYDKNTKTVVNYENPEIYESMTQE